MSNRATLPPCDQMLSNSEAEAGDAARDDGEGVCKFHGLSACGVNDLGADFNPEPAHSRRLPTQVLAQTLEPLSSHRGACCERRQCRGCCCDCRHPVARAQRSEEHTSELQSLMRKPYAVFCL